MLTIYWHTCWPFACLLLEKYLFKSFVHFLIELFEEFCLFFCGGFLFFAFYYWGVWVSYIFSILIDIFEYHIYISYIHSHIQNGRYFLPFCRLPFYSVDCFLCHAAAFWFNVILLVYFCFCYLCFCCHIR